MIMLNNLINKTKKLNKNGLSFVCLQNIVLGQVSKFSLSKIPIFSLVKFNLIQSFIGHFGHVTLFDTKKLY